MFSLSQAFAAQKFDLRSLCQQLLNRVVVDNMNASEAKEFRDKCLAVGMESVSVPLLKKPAAPLLKRPAAPLLKRPAAPLLKRPAADCSPKIPASTKEQQKSMVQFVKHSADRLDADNFVFSASSSSLDIESL